MADLFQKLELEAFRAGINPRTEQSREWFRKKAQRLTRVNREKLMKSEVLDRDDDALAGNTSLLR